MNFLYVYIFSLDLPQLSKVSALVDLLHRSYRALFEILYGEVVERLPCLAIERPYMSAARAEHNVDLPVAVDVAKDGALCQEKPKH